MNGLSVKLNSTSKHTVLVLPVKRGKSRDQRIFFTFVTRIFLILWRHPGPVYAHILNYWFNTLLKTWAYSSCSLTAKGKDQKDCQKTPPNNFIQTPTSQKTNKQTRKKKNQRKKAGEKKGKILPPNYIRVLTLLSSARRKY